MKLVAATLYALRIPFVESETRLKMTHTRSGLSWTTIAVPSSVPLGGGT